MRHLILSLLGAFLFSTTTLNANIDDKIEAIQKAPLHERFKLMNAFKKEILHMRDQERMTAISKLKSITNSQHSHQVIKEIKQASGAKPAKKERTFSYIKKRMKREEKTDHTIQNEIKANIEADSEEHIENETEDHVENEAEDHIENETEDHIENETEDHIEDETEDHIEDENEHDDD
ncbi:hypothetical protein PGH07_07310 [Sulfurovum sp. zt1-1]|uniref:Uncharacterized protein n=1 Tax=Sulfurovum zhangzhouensis TaxID=3019067 RepID=A0ABT7QYS4_9BACT|nr:hypothetical protein [Sulfurovum zhangzhouensis]MDM5271982.1 hypothetical protein [Sulfurovum zhangzhouensis]